MHDTANKDTFGFINWVVLAFVAIFFLFNSGENVTKQFKIFHDELYHCDWYLFPIGMQQMLVTFMSLTQQPVVIQGYGYNLSQCTRENFKKVK